MGYQRGVDVGRFFNVNHFYMVGRGLGGACGLVLCYVFGSCLGLCLLMLGCLIVVCTLMMVGRCALCMRVAGVPSSILG